MTTFTHDFDELKVTIEGRVKYVAGRLDVSYNRVREYCGMPYYEIDTGNEILVECYIDGETEEAHPCAFTLQWKTEAYQAIVDALNEGRWTLQDACADDYDNGEWGYKEWDYTDAREA